RGGGDEGDGEGVDDVVDDPDGLPRPVALGEIPATLNEGVALIRLLPQRAQPVAKALCITQAFRFDHAPPPISSLHAGRRVSTPGDGLFLDVIPFARKTHGYSSSSSSS